MSESMMTFTGSTGAGRGELCVTVIVTVAMLLLTNPLFAINVKLSDPLNPGVGVYVTFGGVPVSVPLCGCVTIVYVKGLLFGSVAVKVIGTAAPKLLTTLWAFAVGACTVLTVMDTFAIFLVKTPLLAVNVKLSGPVYPVPGMYVRFGAVPLRLPCDG